MNVKLTSSGGLIIKADNVREKTIVAKWYIEILSHLNKLSLEEVGK